ncbi:hypothetical protein KAW08_05215, partial [bacterium]|nr:hypothetical protein [bacterium]
TSELPLAFEIYHLALTSLCFLESISDYIENGGGSRGSFVIIDSMSKNRLKCKKGELFKYRKENIPLKNKIQYISYNKDRLSISYEDVRPLPEDDSWYETTWADWKGKNIFK